MSAPRQEIFYLHLLRAVAAIAVIAIHVLGPFRQMYGEIPLDAWFSAVAINASARWAVPLFMMISGALLLSSSKPFDAQYYLQRRLGKVVVPFVGWTLIYLAATSLLEGPQAGLTALIALNTDPAWYHLWFFYDFIPLYFVIPLLAPLLKAMSEEQVKLLVVAWLTLTLMHLLKVPTPLSQNLILYSGYLVLGWYLFNHDTRAQWRYWIGLGVAALAINWVGSYLLTAEKGSYNALFMGYKTLNTVLIGAMIFLLAQRYAEAVGPRLRRWVTSLSTYSLGIYLLHPMLLIPVRTAIERHYDAFGHPALAIPLITLVTLLVAWALTALLSRIPLVRKLVP
ncbi:acyltransferase [Ferrimonas gelatinilytica]|uniref:Acyltransferase family protein n=1 Tax=Ferrimonas gelatinilytica TaxID=1255257 RepID=A0ABP9RX29_9GAMM